MARVYASAKIMRAMKSKYRPHQGKKELSKGYLGFIHCNGKVTAGRVQRMDIYIDPPK